MHGTGQIDQSAAGQVTIVSLLATAPRISACAQTDPPVALADGHRVACLRWREQAL